MRHVESKRNGSTSIGHHVVVWILFLIFFLLTGAGMIYTALVMLDDMLSSPGLYH